MLYRRTVSLRSLYVSPANISSDCLTQRDADDGGERGDVLRSDIA
jgi:hypothetical protein